MAVIEKWIFLLSLLLSLVFPLEGQGVVNLEDLGIDDDDLNIGGDIFTDFNEDIEASQVLEDERYYRYGRFFVFQLGLGLTAFDGNRGATYTNDHPSYQISLGYFANFETAFHLGFGFSKHNFFLRDPTQNFPSSVGAVDVSALRVFFGHRQYLDTANLGTAITYANPYFTWRLEYWYLTNKFIDQSGFGADTGGGLGLGVGGGLEFPLEFKKKYLNIEILFHKINLHDKNTQAYRAIDDGDGIDDLTGNGYGLVISYVMNW